MPSHREYRDKVVSAESALRMVPSGSRMFISSNAAAPLALLRALGEQKDRVSGITISHAMLLSPAPLLGPEVSDRFRHNSLFVGPADREAVNQGRADYVPVFLHEIPELIAAKHLPVDVAVVQTTPPDRHGLVSLGVEVLASQTAVKHARTVIAQVNPRMPRTLGDSFVHVSEIDAFFEADEDLPELEQTAPGQDALGIGRHVASLVEDGDTLQLGIGQIPDAVLMALQGKRDLGVHSEMVSDGVIKAMEAGIITGARKSVHDGKVVATFVLGSKRLYQYVHDNPQFELHPVDYTNDPFLASQNERLVAINSALEIDLTGQVCADTIGTYIYSGFGGQVDFIRAAARSKGGKPIIALPSTARNGAVSRIVPFLKPGAGVVTTRGDVHYVVTEFGVAHLVGKNLRQRARALIDIAHPKFRPWLEEEASKVPWMRAAT
jgi:acyl-CoA hydrolase